MESLLNSIKQFFFYKNNFIVTDLEKNHFVVTFYTAPETSPFPDPNFVHLSEQKRG